MVINYQDKNLIVMYLQIYLSEYLGLTVHKVVPKSKKQKTYYEITSNDPLIVTGYYNTQTYSALALYMAYNYPNEGFPIKWTKTDTDTWEKEDYIYQGDQEELKIIISSNIEYSAENRDTIQVPERVLSYIFNEVVTPESSPEEILRIKSMVYNTIYADIDNPTPLGYDEDLFNLIIQIQQKLINKYTIRYQDKVTTVLMANEETTYQIDKQVGKIKAIATERFTERFSGEDITVAGSRVIVNINTDNIISSKVIYEDEGQVKEQDAVSFSKVNNKWTIVFSENLSNVEELTVVYEEKFSYNIITGKITFENYKDNKSIEITESINEEINFPPQFLNFKVTGYVDPWTEIILKEGYEDGDS